MTRFLVADPDDYSRKALTLLLKFRLHGEAIFEAVDGKELVEQWQQQPLAAGYTYDIECTITTAAGRTWQETVSIQVVAR